MVVPLQWVVSIKGGNEVKTTLNQLNEALEKNVITEQEYAKALQQTGRQANQVLSINRNQERVLRAQYPALQRVSRAMSTMASISRTALTITNALNLARMSGNLQDSATIAKQNELNAELRERQRLIDQHLVGTKAWIENEEKIKLTTAEIAEEHKKAADQFLIDMITTAGSIALVVNAAVDLGIKAIPEMKKFITGIKGLSGAKVLESLTNLGKGFTDMFGKLAGGNTKRAIGGIVALGAGMTMLATGGFDALTGKSEKVEDKLKALGGIGAVGVGIALEVPEIAKIALIGTAIVVATTAIILFRKEIGGAFEEIGKQINSETITKFFNEDFPASINTAGIALNQFFMTDLPLWVSTGLATLTPAFVATWNGIVTAINVGVNSVIDGINFIVNGAISAINWFISRINSALGKWGTSIPLITSFTGIPSVNLPLIPAAKGFDGMVNSPTMFLAGEAGSEHVSITPHGKSSGGDTIIINVGGSVVTERKLAQIVDQYQKQNLKSRGFTGFG